MYELCCPNRTKVISNDRLSQPLQTWKKERAFPYSAHQAYCSTLGRKVYITKVVFLKKSFKLKAIIHFRLRCWRMVIQNDPPISGDLKLAKLLNNNFSQLGFELLKIIVLSVYMNLHLITFKVKYCILEKRFTDWWNT